MAHLPCAGVKHRRCTGGAAASEVIKPDMGRFRSNVEAQVVGEFKALTEWLVELLHTRFVIACPRQP